jgi:5-methylcytosine-specific restriction endonuclease McrA
MIGVFMQTMRMRTMRRIRIDINKADKMQLTQIHGIGRILATRIIEQRPYETIDEIRRKVKGIGEKRKMYLKNNVIIHKRKSITDATKRIIAGRQYYKCANKPKPSIILSQFQSHQENGEYVYMCPLWERANENKGSFDQSGYEIDHKDEFSESQDNRMENLQALCKSCHTMKTKMFAMYRSKITLRSKNNINMIDRNFF